MSKEEVEDYFGKGFFFVNNAANQRQHKKDEARRQHKQVKTQWREMFDNPKKK